MDALHLSKQVEARYRQYLQTTFYFRDPQLRASFQAALDAGVVGKGPYLEATPVFRRAGTPRTLFTTLFGNNLDEGFLSALKADRPLYFHQEQSIKHVDGRRNVVVATGTGSGKTESFLYPILLHLYREFARGELAPGVQALILYPMNALANDQRDRLGDICRDLEKFDSKFRFTFGQYIGETPEDKHDHDQRRNAGEALDKRLPGELVLRTEMRAKPPNILLTNYSMLEYLLLRPHDSPLFDNGNAKRWTFLVVDEAHQYRGSQGIEMGMLLRRLKQRVREGGRTEPFRCIATSATLVSGEGGKPGVSKFAASLFGEPFEEQAIIFGRTEAVPEFGSASLNSDDYTLLEFALSGDAKRASDAIEKAASKLGIQPMANTDIAKSVGHLLKHDKQATALRRLGLEGPREVEEVANAIFGDVPFEQQVSALSRLIGLLLRAQEPTSGAALFSARFHLFLKSLEGAFVSYFPEKRIFLTAVPQHEWYLTKKSVGFRPVPERGRKGVVTQERGRSKLLTQKRKGSVQTFDTNSNSLLLRVISPLLLPTAGLRLQVRYVPPGPPSTTPRRSTSRSWPFSPSIAAQSSPSSDRLCGAVATPTQSSSTVINRPGISHSEFSRHAPSLSLTRHLCQCLGPTPFLSPCVNV